MAASGYEVDPVDREFDRLLAETGRAVSRRATDSPVSDAAFESLLTAFKSLNVSDRAGGPGEKPGRPTAPATPAAIQAAAEDVARAWRSFVPHLAGPADPVLHQAARRMQRAVIALQRAQQADSSQAVLAVSVASQPFALALDQVVDVLDVSQVRLERDGARVWAIVGTERAPLCFARHWLAQGTDMTAAEDAWIVMTALGSRRAGFVVDGVEEVVPASRQPPGALWRGVHGVDAVAAAGTRLLPLLDLAAFLNDSTCGG